MNMNLMIRNLEVIRGAELVHQPLRPFCFLHDTFFIILPYRSTEFIVVHGGPVLPLTPEPCNFDRILDFEDTLRSIQPSNARTISLRVCQEFFEELPKVYMRRGSRCRGSIVIRRGNWFIIFI